MEARKASSVFHLLPPPSALVPHQHMGHSRLCAGGLACWSRIGLGHESFYWSSLENSPVFLLGWNFEIRSKEHFFGVLVGTRTRWLPLHPGSSAGERNICGKGTGQAMMPLAPVSAFHLEQK